MFAVHTRNLCDLVEISSFFRNKLKLQRNHFSRYGMGCFGAYFTHAQSCDKVCVQRIRNGLLAYIYLTHAQSCDNVRVQRATEWIAFSPFSSFRLFRVFAFSFFPVSVLGVFAFSCSAGGIPAAGTQISCAQFPQKVVL